MPPDDRAGRCFQVRLVPERAPDGTVESVLAVARDVTQLKQTEAELRARTFELGERVKELRCLYAISTMLAEAGPDLDCLQVVNAMPAGWRFPELATARIVLDGREYATPGFRRTSWCQHAAITDNDEAIGTVEVCYRERPAGVGDGAIFLDEECMLLASIADQIGTAVRRRRAEQALTSREARFRGLIENASDLIAIFDADRRACYISPSYERVLGYSVDEALAADLFALIHPEDREAVLGVFHGLVQGTPGCRRTVSFRLRHKDGSWKHLESAGTNLLHDPDVHGIVVNTRDLTERVRLEEQFRQAQKMEAVGRLAGGIAHDFNNVLTVIEANAAFLLEELGGNDPRRQDAEEIQRAAERAASLTRQLLAFSRRQVLQPRVLDLNTVVADMDKMLRRLIGDDIELRTELAQGLPAVLSDPGQLEQVMLNLAVNARDAMPQGGKLTIETRAVELDADYAGAHDIEPGAYVMIAVSDTGEGIPRETQLRIFEPFFTTKTHGTGLGLATVYGIVKQSQGHVAVYSEPGQGSTFKVYLPATEQGAGRERREAFTVADVRGTENVLLVEDEPAVRAVATRVLREAGYTVLEAASGPDAIALAEREARRIDVLVTDVIMPHMSGRELADRLLARQPGLQVLYVSGYTDDSILHHGVLEPGVFFLEKPFTAEALLRKVRQVLATRPAAR